MKRFLLTGITALTVACGASAAWHKVLDPKAQPSFRTMQPAGVKGGWSTVVDRSSKTSAMRAAAQASPAHTLESGRIYGILGPDGSQWFALMDLDVELIKHEAYTERLIKGFTCEVYDNDFKKIGTVSDDIDLREGETKVADIMPCTNITQKFFNYDTKYELMVSVMLNTPDYTVNSRTLVYSIGSTKDDDGKDVPVSEMAGYPVVGLNAASDSWSEDFYLSFYTTFEPDVEDFEDYKDFLNAHKAIITTYKKGGYSGGPTPVDVYEVAQTQLPGDQMEDPFYIPMVKDGKFTVLTAAYEKPFFEDASGMSGNENITADNRLVVKVRQLQGYGATELTEIASMTMPTTPCTDDGIVYTFYTVGSFLYDGDVDFEHFTADGTPWFYVTRSLYSSASDDQYIRSIYLYDAEGNLQKTIAENVESYMLLSDIKGQEPQAMFIYNNGSDHTYDFVDLYSGESRLTTSNVVGGQTITTALDRVQTAGGYMYAALVSGAYDAADGNTHTSFCWLNTDGEIDHIDEVSLGKDVALAQAYVVGEALNPYIFNTDPLVEYMFLVKRSISGADSATQEELMVVNTADNAIFSAVPSAEKGALSGIELDAATPRLYVYYSNDNGMTGDSYTLPFTCFAGGDGTPANPYQIATVGDLQQIKSAKGSSFVLTNDIDASGFNFVSIENFGGVLDGNGHTVSNLTVSGSGIFAFVENGATVKNINFLNASMELPRNAQYSGLVAGLSRGLNLTNVNIYGLTVSSDAFSSAFGCLAGRLSNFSSVSLCQVTGAAVNLPAASTVGGIVGDLLSSSTVNGCSFAGAITAESELGGIAGAADGAGTITNCHVDADLKAGNTIGGVLGSSQRAVLSQNYVEGTITATEPSNWGGYIAGGLIGDITPAKGYDDEGNPITSTEAVIYSNIVAVDEIKTEGELTRTPSYPSQFQTVHRVIGRSLINYEPEVIDYDADYEPIYGDPMPADAGFKDNYVISALEPVQESVEATAASTEGETKNRYSLEPEFLAGLGFQAGTDAEKPWNLSMYYDPSLYFETSALLLTPHLQTSVGETVTVAVQVFGRRLLTADDVMGDFMFECDETRLEMADMGFEANVLTIGLNALAEGTAPFYVKLLGSTMQGDVEIAPRSGLTEAVAAGGALTYDGTTLRASGCTIEVHNVVGVRVASGVSAVSTAALAPGVYIARALSAVGESSVLKFAVR